MFAEGTTGPSLCIVWLSLCNDRGRQFVGWYYELGTNTRKEVCSDPFSNTAHSPMALMTGPSSNGPSPFTNRTTTIIRDTIYFSCIISYRTFYSVAEKDFISSILFMLYFSYLWTTSFLVFIYITPFLPLGDLISNIWFILHISCLYFGDVCLDYSIAPYEIIILEYSCVAYYCGCQPD